MKICLIGSGNVGTHLGKALVLSGHEIVQVFSRSSAHAETLVKQLTDLLGPLPQHPHVITDIQDLEKQSDLYIICVSDRAISSVIAQLPTDLSGIVVHTSGSTSMDVFAELPNTHPNLKYGVFYPLQTFTKGKEIDFNVIPLALEAQDEEVYQVLETLAKPLSQNVFPCSSKQREALHIAAVFACNFSNYFFHEAEKLLERNQLSFDLVRPLILEMATKAQVISPRFGQTGPAVRKDWNIVQKHLDFLDNDPETDPRIRRMYEELSVMISEMNDDKA